MLVVGIGGTTRSGSSTEAGLQLALDAAAAEGAETVLFGGADLALPHYEPGLVQSSESRRMIDAVRAADGLIIASPGYHGTISGLVKNALDHLEELRSDSRPYLDGMPVGCIGVAYGWQAAVNTLRALRDVVHALRGWPTPYGAVANSAGGGFTEGAWVDTTARENLELVGRQVAERLMDSSNLGPR